MYTVQLVCLIACSIHLQYIATDCEPLTFPENGYVTVSGSVASYYCNGIFVLRGPSSRVCGVNGSWSGEAPVCESESTLV